MSVGGILDDWFGIETGSKKKAAAPAPKPAVPVDKTVPKNPEHRLVSQSQPRVLKPKRQVLLNGIDGLN